MSNKHAYVALAVLLVLFWGAVALLIRSALS